MAERAYERFLKDPNKEEAVNIDIKDSKPLDLDQIKLKIQIKLKNNIKVASKYPNITKKFFLEKGFQCSVMKLYGSIELAAVLNMVDAIVDLVETGRTLKENGLKAVSYTHLTLPTKA